MAWDDRRVAGTLILHDGCLIGRWIRDCLRLKSVADDWSHCLNCFLYFFKRKFALSAIKGYGNSRFLVSKLKEEKGVGSLGLLCIFL